MEKVLLFSFSLRMPEGMVLVDFDGGLEVVEGFLTDLDLLF